MQEPGTFHGYGGGVKCVCVGGPPCSESEGEKKDGECQVLEGSDGGGENVSYESIPDECWPIQKKM